jgi:hypothetical protein
MSESRIDAVSGVATLEVRPNRWVQQFTVTPDSASGTGTVTVRPSNAAGFEQLFDKDGVAVTIDLSAQKTYIAEGSLTGIKVTSDNSSDTFELSVAYQRMAK